MSARFVPLALCLVATWLFAAAGCARTQLPKNIPAFSGGDAGNLAGDGGTLSLLGARGRDIVDASGTPVTLKGVNLGGWFVWELWLWGGAFKGETDFQTHLASAVGQPETDAFTQRVFSELIQEEDLREISRLGFNVVRVPFTRKLLEDPTHPGQFLESGFTRLDQVLAWCERYGIWAVLDLHSAPGGQSSYFMADPEATLLWSSADAQARTVALWKAVATRYVDRNVVAGYDLLNEPIPNSGAQLHDLDAQIAQAIRAVDPRHLLFVEGANFAKDFSMFPTPLDPQLVYSFHSYETGSGQVKAVQGYAALATAQNVPLWAGEFGMQSPSAVAEAVKTFHDARVAGYALWTWKRATTDSSGLVRIIADRPDWSNVMTWTWLWGGANRPTASSFTAAQTQFFTAARLSEANENTEMVTALGGTP